MNINLKNRILVNLISILIILFITNVVKSQTYELNLSDPATYTYGSACSSANPAQWSVSNDSCWIQTSALKLTETGKVPILFKLNLSGNLECDDNAYIQYSIDGEAFYNDTVINGCDYTSVFDYNDTLNLSSGQTIQIRIICETNNSNENWQIKDGDITVYGAEILPIELLYFNAVCNNDVAEINWSTASEINNDYFNIEKSKDGIYFEVMATINGAGTSNIQHDYFVIDENPYQRISYYRLKQTDYDGKYKYSDIIAISNINKNTDCKLNIFPNPFIDNITILINNLHSSSAKIEIYDILGNKVTEHTLYDIDSNNNKFIINLSELFKGPYLIKFISDNFVRTQRIIKK
jgi:hypothetical protein